MIIFCVILLFGCFYSPTVSQDSVPMTMSKTDPELQKIHDFLMKQPKDERIEYELADGVKKGVGLAIGYQINYNIHYYQTCTDKGVGEMGRTLNQNGTRCYETCSCTAEVVVVGNGNPSLTMFSCRE